MFVTPVNYDEIASGLVTVLHQRQFGWLFGTPHTDARSAGLPQEINTLFFKRGIAIQTPLFD